MTTPVHLSKDQGIVMQAGDRVEVMTPGGGGYGDPFARAAQTVARDVRLGYYRCEEARTLYGVALRADGEVDMAETERLRHAPVIPDGAVRAEGECSSDPGPREPRHDPFDEIPDSLAFGSTSGMTGGSR
jgi:hypothetical protein